MLSSQFITMKICEKKDHNNKYGAPRIHLLLLLLLLPKHKLTHHTVLSVPMI